MKHILLTTATILLATVSLMAQDLIVPKKGNPITVYNVDAGGTFIYYTLEQDANSALSRIAKDSVLMIRRADGSVMDLTATQPTTSAPATPAVVEKPKVDYPVIDEADIHGSLIAKGNKVFIPTNSLDECERSGQEQLKKRVQEWDYWTVVDVPEQAHFVLQYYLKTDGHDVAYMVIRPRKYYRENPTFFYGVKGNFNGKTKGENAGVCLWQQPSDDSNSQLNTAIANKFFESLKGLLTNPDYKNNNKEDKILYDWFVCKTIQERLDADNETNDCSYF